MFEVIATRKNDTTIKKVLLSTEDEAKAEKYCEEWGWSYDDGHHSYWLAIEEK